VQWSAGVCVPGGVDRADCHVVLVLAWSRREINSKLSDELNSSLEMVMRHLSFVDRVVSLVLTNLELHNPVHCAGERNHR
jgi:hypothetical protein